MRIAALDDDALQLDLIKQATEAMGHVCHTHLTGAELMRTLRRETFDLLIVDWHLPDTTGPEVVRWVRQNVAARVPILFVTHRQEERDIVEGLAAARTTSWSSLCASASSTPAWPPCCAAPTPKTPAA